MVFSAIKTGTRGVRKVRRHTGLNQNQVNPVCLLCHREDETVEHFLLHCPALACLRNPIIDTILSVCTGVYSPTNSFLQLILDHSALTSFTNASNNEQLHSIEFHCRRLCHTLHCERYRLLSLVPGRQGKKNKTINYHNIEAIRSTHL